MIQLTQEEMYAWNELNSAVQLGQEELQRRVKARDAFIRLLEANYNAKFDYQKGQFIPVDGSKDKKKAKAELTNKGKVEE